MLKNNNKGGKAKSTGSPTGVLPEWLKKKKEDLKSFNPIYYYDAGKNCYRERVRMVKKRNLKWKERVLSRVVGQSLRKNAISKYLRTTMGRMETIKGA